MQLISFYASVQDSEHGTIRDKIPLHFLVSYPKFDLNLNNNSKDANSSVCKDKVALLTAKVINDCGFSTIHNCRLYDPAVLYPMSASHTAGQFQKQPLRSSFTVHSGDENRKLIMHLQKSEGGPLISRLTTQSCTNLLGS